MSDATAIILAVIGTPAALLVAYASVVSAVRSTQVQRETQTNGGSSMRDEIRAIVVSVDAAHVHAEAASVAAQEAVITARLAADGVARADAFHLYMHDRVHDLANGIVGNRGQIAALRSELGLDPNGERRADPNIGRAILPDRMYPPSGETIANPFGTKPTPTKE